MREHPAIEVRRELALVIDVAARARRYLPACRAAALDDLVIGEDVRQPRRRRHCTAAPPPISRRPRRSPRGRGLPRTSSAPCRVRPRRPCRRRRARSARTCRCGVRRRLARHARAAIRRRCRGRPCRQSRRLDRHVHLLVAMATTMRAELTRATSRWSGISKSRISRGGMAPPQGLMRPARSSSRTVPPPLRQIVRRGGAGRPAADHHHVEGIGVAHHSMLRPARHGRSPCDPARRRAGADEPQTRQQAASDEQHALRPRNTRDRPGAGVDEQASARHRCRACRESRRCRTRWPAPRPTGPCARPRGFRRRAPASSIIEPIAATAKTPLATPSMKTVSRSGQPGQRSPAAASAASASAEARQPPTVQSCSDSARTRQSAPVNAHQHHADQHAAVLHARRAWCLARRHAEHRARQKARGSGPGRCRPASRRRRRSRSAAPSVRPRPPSAPRGTALAVLPCDAQRPRRRALPSMPQTPSSVSSIAATDTDAGTATAAARRERIEHMAGQSGRDDEAGDHHDPDDCRGRRPPLGIDPLGQQHQQRRAGSADADADQAEAPAPPSAMPSARLVAIQAVAGGRQQAADRQHRHAADDPGRSPRRRDRSHSPSAGRNTCRRSEWPPAAPGTSRRQREFDHHHPVERRGGQHDDRAERGLDEPEPDDAEPARGRVSMSCTARIDASAKALTSMPRT